MYSFADSQSAMLGLAPKCSPLQWISKPAFPAEGEDDDDDDDTFSVGKEVELDDDRSWGKVEEESACSGSARIM